MSTEVRALLAVVDEIAELLHGYAATRELADWLIGRRRALTVDATESAVAEISRSIHDAAFGMGGLYDIVLDQSGLAPTLSKVDQQKLERLIDKLVALTE